MDKYEFLKLCSEYGGITKEMQIDYGESIIDTYNSLVENGEITQFHGFVCMVSDKVRENTYVLIPYTGTYQELQEDSAFTEYHYWRAIAEKKRCDICNKIYFVANKNEDCPNCQNKK